MNKSKTGSLRENSGKPEVTQLDPRFIRDLAALMTKCASKYKKFNWALGQEYLTPCDSLYRHLLSFTEGEDIDPESGFPHVLHIAANSMIIYRSMLIEKTKKLGLDNRFLGFMENKNEK